MKLYRVYVNRGYDFEWTNHSVEARSAQEARRIWKDKASPSETRKFRVSEEKKGA